MTVLVFFFFFFMLKFLLGDDIQQTILFFFFFFSFLFSFFLLFFFLHLGVCFIITEVKKKDTCTRTKKRNNYFLEFVIAYHLEQQ